MSLFLPIIFLSIIVLVFISIYKYILYKFSELLREDYGLQGTVGHLKILPGRTPKVHLDKMNLIKITNHSGIPNNTVILSCERLLFSLSIPALFRGNIQSEKIFFSGTGFFLEQYEDGTNTFSRIFLKEKKEAKEPYSFLNFHFSTSLKEISFKNTELNLNVKKTDNLLKIESPELIISEIHIDPKNLAEFNSIRLDFSTSITVRSNRESKESAKFVIESHGLLQPLDPVTGRLRANLSYDIRLLRGSYIEEFALFKSLTKSLPFLQSSKLDGMMSRVVLKEELKLSIEYGNGMVVLMETAEFETEYFTLILKEGSSLCITDSTHRFHGIFIPSQKVSEIFFQNLEILSGEIGMNTNQILEILFKDLYQGGKFRISFQSSGVLKDPEANILGFKIPSADDLKKGNLLKILKENVKHTGRTGMEIVNSFTNLFFKDEN